MENFRTNEDSAAFRRSNPEANLMAKRALEDKGSFESLSKKISDEEAKKLVDQNHLNFVGKLEKNGWPMDEETCDAIGEACGYTAEEAAAVSRYMRSIH